MLRTVEKYEVLDEIGHGGMATVYRARDTRLDRLVALKVLHPHLRGSAEARVRFTREARSVAKLQHPNVLEVYDYSGEGSEESYIAAELLTGPTLKDYVEHGREAPAEIAACMGVQIARALGAAHEKGIVHRDVKPENVLLHERRLLKLTDFGIAHMIDNQGFTATGQILGSPGHMAPEQVEGGECDERTDIFALGTVLYYVSTGRLPFVGKNPPQILRRVIDCEFPDPLRIRPSIGGTLRAIIMRAMAREPSARYGSVDELEAALLAFLAQSGIDDPDARLSAYLRDPEGEAAALRVEVVARLTELGSEAAARREIPIALEHWNRVLALDEANDEVLRRIQSLGRVESRRRALRVGLSAALATGLLATVAYGANGVLQGYADARVEDVPGPGASPAIEPTEGPEAVVNAAVSAASPSAIGDAGSAPASTARASGRTEREEPRRVVRRPVVATGPRTVVFQPEPQNVLIGVDGAAPRPFGPAFRSIELEPGHHRFRLVAGTECCRDLEFGMTVEPGDGPLVIRRALPFNEARLYVVSNVPADVRVTGPTGAAVRGRARDFLAVPMRRLEEGVTFAVTAPGHSDYTGQVRLRAGQVARTQVALQPSEAPP